MLLHALTLLVGLLALIGGSDRTVAGASTFARAHGFSAFFVGVTLVAVGSSLPEIATSVYGAAYGQGPLVIGHVVGSATSQITLGIGTVALLAPLPGARDEVRVYGIGMVVAMSAMLLAAASGVVSRLEGVVMALAYLGFIAARYRLAEDRGAADSQHSDADALSHPLLWVGVGLALVVGGGHLLVTGARGVAATLGAPTYLLGLLTGLGTTTPEIVVAALAVRREEGGIAVGTLFGSNITDPLFSLGVGAAVAPLAVENVGATMTSIGYMLAVSAAVALLFHRREEVGRWGGVACLALYVPVLFLG